MSGEKRKQAPRKGQKGEAAGRERRQRQAEQLRANLLKRKEQSRGRADRGPQPEDPGEGSAQG